LSINNHYCPIISQTMTTGYNKGVEVGSQRSEVRGRKSEVGSQRSEVRGRKSEGGSQRSEVRGRKSEVGRQGAKIRGQGKNRMNE